MIAYTPILQALPDPVFREQELTVDVLRLDLIHPAVSGNKWFKLKYNLEEARRLGHNTILTFGGAFSNHIHAAAAACRLAGFNSIGVIRGEEGTAMNGTLSGAAELGMQLHFIPREAYRKKEDALLTEQLRQKFGDFYMVPEGGNNTLGVKGCSEILSENTDHDYICGACGTLATYQGLQQSLKAHQELIGISVLKNTHTEPGVVNEYHFGGYARHRPELLEFKADFEKRTGIPLDYVYTAKLFFAVYDLAAKGRFQKGKKVLIIHSGGLQGNKGYEERYSLKPSR